MKTIFINGGYKGKIELGKEVINYLKNRSIKSLAIFASVQFLELDTIKQQLKETGIKVLTTKAKRASEEGQIIGCDCYEDSFQEKIIEKSDAILYIGDGLFHPKALLLAQIGSKIKPIIQFNPLTNSLNILTEKEIEKQIKRLKANIKLYLNAKKIGLLVTIKPGQQYLNLALRLKEKLEKENKKAFIFISDSIDLKQLENFNFIEAWVNTACPRIGSDDILTTSKPIINIREVFEPLKWLGKLN